MSCKHYQTSTLYILYTRKKPQHITVDRVMLCRVEVKSGQMRLESFAEDGEWFHCPNTGWEFKPLQAQLSALFGLQDKVFTLVLSKKMQMLIRLLLAHYVAWSTTTAITALKWAISAKSTKYSCKRQLIGPSTMQTKQGMGQHENLVSRLASQYIIAIHKIIPTII